jgi:N-acetylglucosaminyl-diphospho-decaprenol L-rhamnosyltransferase
MTAPAVDVSVILVNWNSADDLRRCLESLYRHTRGITFEVIVIDNASYDGSERMVNEQFPHVRYIQNNENRGFALANNWGVQHSSGRILMFLNPDTLVLGDALPKMVRALDSLGDAGALGCRILNADGTLQTSCVQALPTLLNQAFDSEALRSRFPDSHLWGLAPLSQPGTEPRHVEMISGACLMVRRHVFEKVGGFTNHYFMYAEDADLCYKVARAGWKLYYLPHAEVIHYGGQSASKRGESMFSVLEMQKSLKMYFANTRGPLSAFAFQLSRFLTAVLRVAIIGATLSLASGQEARAQRKASLRKWMAILRWSLGRSSQPSNETSAARPPAEQRQESQPRTGVV